ncbi:MAG: hypothetical protein HY831_01425 [Candidatus Aenigmarchaeota archaeon]|nr:hypothetical protein [Candidatus Aenigmarchaeota archaeon]
MEEDKVSFKLSIKPLFKYKYAAIIILIIALSMYIRLFGFYEHGWPYLRNIDSFYFTREVGSIINNNGVLPSYDYLRFAPNGIPIGSGPLFYEYLGAYSYMFFHLFMPDMQLWQFMVWFPVLLTSLLAIPSYFIGKYLFNRKAGAFIAIFVLFAIPFLTRTLGGDPDSDAIVMLMMMASIASFVVAYKKLDKEKIFARKNIIYSAIAGLFLGLFALTWTGYWFALWIIASFVVLKIIFDILLTKKHDTNHIKQVFSKNKVMVVSFIMIIAVFYIITIPYYGVGFLSNPVQSVVGSVASSGSLKAETSQFPNVYVSVAELQSGGIKDVAIRVSSVDIASQISGIPLALLLLISPFILTIVCFIYLLYSYVKKRHHFDTLLFMLIWFIGFLVASAVAVRFDIFLTAVYSICSGIILAKFWDIALYEKEDKE